MRPGWSGTSTAPSWARSRHPGDAQFTWQLGTVGSASQVVDGTYEVSATAIDANGDSGTQGSVQVQVNRRAPVAPSGFLAGRER